MLEHSLCGRNGYAVTEFFNDFLGYLLRMFRDNFIFKRIFRTANNVIARFRGDKNINKRKKYGKRVSSVYEERHGEYYGVNGKYHRSYAPMRILLLYHRPDYIRTAR